MVIDGILCLTHSSRNTDLRHCSLNTFTRRYSDSQRLKRLPPFHSLKPEGLDYFGALSLFRIQGTPESLQVNFLVSRRSNYKIQHAIFLDQKTIAVLYESFIEILKFDITKSHTFSIEQKIEHPLLAGLHTIEKTHRNTLLISASAPDAVLEINLLGKLERILKMPEEIYGKGYDISPVTDLHINYIANDYQTTHINMASMTKDRKYILVSALIPGAVGRFHYETGEYEELTGGFLGCHGAREAYDGRIYFADSVNGNLVFLDQKGRISERFSVNSRWLHDVLEIHPRIFTFTLSDYNNFQIFNIDDEILLYKKKFIKYPNVIRHKYINIFFKNWLGIGNSTQFLSFFPLKEND